MRELTPRQIVEELDRHIVGQNEAKRAVAIAIRNRWRRLQLPEEMRQEVAPKNIIMIGPTGVGKTEIARRLAQLTGAPLIKVEATKYTEVGYYGRDVESMVRDLVEVMNDPHLHRRGMLHHMEHPELGPIIVPHSPLRYDGLVPMALTPSRALGADNDEFYAAFLGLTPAELDQLRDQGVI